MRTKGELTDAKLAFKNAYAAWPGIAGVGIGDDTLLVYVCERSVCDGLPLVFNHVGIEFVVIGHPTATG